MKKIILSTVFISAATVVSAQAQLRTQTSELRDARKQMEVQTENTVLEKLEASRLEDERNRRQHFEALNFSVVNDNSSIFMNPISGQQAQQIPQNNGFQQQAAPTQNVAPVPVVIAPGYN